jgi:hypothetical protein
MRFFLVVTLGLGLAAPAAAQTEVPVETARLAGQEVILHVQPFLTDEELLTLRLVLQSKEALALFVKSDKGFGAMAVAPDEGFIRDGQPVASAVAIAGLADAETAARAALEDCEKARKKGADCVLVLEVGPAN